MKQKPSVRLNIGVIAGNRSFPLILLEEIKRNYPDSYVCLVCFKGETCPKALSYADKSYWVKPGHLADLSRVVAAETVQDWIMAGQVNPLRIFRRYEWDDELRGLVKDTRDFRPHSIFSKIISHLEANGAHFLNSTIFMKRFLAEEGVMNGLPVDDVRADIDFGVSLISDYVELDVGQTIVVKNKSAVALESLEGTDKTIRRGYRLAGINCTVVKFSRRCQDLRFDIPVVGPATLKLLRKIKAASLVLETDKVLILDKDNFLPLAKKFGIPIVGRKNPAV